jgi:hypothetical protein
MLFAQTNTTDILDFLAKNKDAFASLESAFKIIGIILAGIWTYLLFVRSREKFPRADLKHRIEFWDISEQERLIRVVLVIKNESDVLLRLFEGETWIQQMKPWPIEAIEKFKELNRKSDKVSAEVGWLLISEKNHNQEREIEPKESDEVSMDFIIDKSYEQILIYSFFENSHKPGRHLAWSTSAVIDFTKNAGAVLQQVQGQAQQKPRPDKVSSPKKGK